MQRSKSRIDDKESINADLVESSDDSDDPNKAMYLKKPKDL